MQKPDIIKDSLNYIERNLNTDIAAEELARLAGYSLYHYYRLFSAVMGTSVAEYVKKRRLDHALGEIAGGRKAVEVVLEYGFETYAGFYKAFMRMYGCSPKKYISIYHGHRPKKPEVAYTLMRTEKDLRKILENWDIPRDMPIRDIYIMDGAKPSGNDWTVGDDYVLRTGSRDMLMKDLRVAKALVKHGVVPTTLTVPTKSGIDYLDGQELFILSRSPKGTPLPKPDRFGPDRGLFGEKYGVALARLDKALFEVQRDVSPDEWNLYRAAVEWALPIVRQQNGQWNMGLNEAFFSDFAESFGKLYDALPRQLVHRNPHPGNVLFENGEVSGIIGFDLSEINVRLWDPVYCATGIMSETGEENHDKWLDVLSGILRGYDRELRLTTEEKRAAFYVVSAVEMNCAAYFETREEYRELARINRRMLQFIARHKDRIDRIF